MSDRKTSLLTNRQREYLRGELEPSNESQMKDRIRTRVYEGLRRDGSILLDNLNPEERRKIFRAWENERNNDLRNDVAKNTNTKPEGSRIFKTDLKIGLERLLGFIYLGVTESNIGEFENLLENGINRAVEERGEYVSEFDFHVELEQQATVEEIFQAVKEDRIRLKNLSISHLEELLESDSVDLNDLSEEKLDKIEAYRNNLQSLGKSVPKK